MAKSVVARCALIFTSWLKLADAADFLMARSHLVREDVKQLLLSELSGHANMPRLGSIEEELRHMYVALPKSKTGQLEPSTVRYALHRYFVAKHGWHVSGLSNAKGTLNSSATTTVLKALAPVYIQSLFEEHLHSKGMGLHELAVFVATLEDLIHAEAAGQLEEIYRALDLPLVGPVANKAADLAIDYFLIKSLDFNSEVVSSRLELQDMAEGVAESYPDLPDTQMWMADLRETHDLAQLSLRNPFVERTATFDESLKFVFEVGHRFGSYQNLECHVLKTKLVQMEHFGTGRVLLSTFYARALAGDPAFGESVEYLRNQGALDETDPNRPSVIIPNYVNSQTNCLRGSDFYTTCCINECEELMGYLERRLATPSATSAQIADVVSSLQSSTVDVPRNLSAALIARLDEIALSNDGSVPLHGRLFAQWMHHAYPRECSFPHTSGTINQLSQDEFMDLMGIEAIAVSEDVMKRHAARVNLTFGAPEALPWTSVEELVAEDEQRANAVSGLPSLQTLSAFVALVSFAVPLTRACRDSLARKESNVEKHLV